MKLEKPALSLVVVGAIGSVFAACSGTSDQEFVGQVGSGWDSPPVSVTAAPVRVESPTGTSGRQDGAAFAKIDPDGSFRLRVVGQETYRLSIEQADGTVVNVLLPQQAGTASSTLWVYGGTAPFDLGTLDRVAPFDSAALAPPAGVTANVASTTQALELGAGGAGAGGSAAGADGEVEDDDENEAEVCGEYEDDEVGTPVQAEEAAVPANVPPNGIGTCDDDSDSDSEDDDDEQEGEHED